MKTPRQKVAPVVLELLKKVRYGRAIVFIETEKLKGKSIQRFLNRRHKRRQLREFKCITRKINGKTAIFITRKLNINFLFSYIV